MYLINFTIFVTIFLKDFLPKLKHVKNNMNFTVINYFPLRRHRHMSKRKKSQKQNSEARQSAPAHTNAASGQMSADELQHMIANAIMEAEDMKAKREADRKAEELAEWHKVIGYDKSKTGIAKVLNGFSSTVKAMFVPKKYIKGDRTFTALIQLLLKSCFQVLRCICSILMLLLIATIPLSFTLSLIPRLN